MAEIYKIVGDWNIYASLPFDPKIKYQRDLETIVDRGLKAGILNKKESLFLVPKAPRIPTVYYLPKNS